MLKGWQIAKINANRKKNPYKQMKDRDMKDVEVVFKRSSLCQGQYYYYFEEIKQPKETITMTYIANLGKTTPSKEYVYKGYGGWHYWLTLNEEQYNRMVNEVERLGGTVRLV